MTNDLAILEDYIQRCSNWGRWGPDDQLGTVNLITADKVREAAALAKAGKTNSLSMPYDARGPQNGYLGRSNPRLYQLLSGPGYLVGEQHNLETHTLTELTKSTGQPTAGFYDDVLVMPTQSGTQWDALCHVFWRGQMYNGHSAADAGTAGSRSNGVQNYTGKIVTRGVFVDLPAYRGVDTLEPGYAITTDDLDEYLAAKNLDIRPGDALIIRTGFMAARRGNWETTPAALRRDCRCTPRRGCATTTLPRLRPTPGELRCCPTRSMSGNHCTWSVLLTRGWRSARCSISMPCRKTAGQTGFTSSCSSRLRCR